MPTFKSAVGGALTDEVLRRNLIKATSHSLRLRREVIEARYPDWQGMREKANAIRARSLEENAALWEQARRAIEARGGSFAIAPDRADVLRRVRAELAPFKNAPVVKSKSMVTEELGLREELERDGFEIYETDLGELIVQFEERPPSHITAPAIHLSRGQIGRIFEKKLNVPYTDDPVALTAMARRFLREKFLAARAGITGANFIVAESGTLVLLENEGNIRLTTALPERIVAVTGLEKIVPTLEDLKVLLRMLPVSATGQFQNCYTSFIPLGKGHTLLALDGWRSRLLANPMYREILKCIRCGACLNICPVYGLVGGHAYRGVYPGPIGVVTGPFLNSSPEPDSVRSSEFGVRSEGENTIQSSKFRVESPSRPDSKLETRNSKLIEVRSSEFGVRSEGENTVQSSELRVESPSRPDSKLETRNSKLAIDNLKLSSLCGACTDICPVKIPIHSTILKLRADAPKPFWEHGAFSAGRVMSRPSVWRAVLGAARMMPSGLLRLAARPWTRQRGPLTPARRSFGELWKKKRS
jgi:L-lactate dehydrogenase complex protein LldF